MNIKLSTAARNARLTALRDKLDADTDPGYIEFYTATQPATGGAAITDQTLLGTCTLSKPSGSVSGGVLTFDVVADDISADADGDIAWARFYDGAGTFVMDGDCGNEASSALIKFNTVVAKAGGIIQVVSGTLTEGNA
jgi:hypothetical protein